MKKVLNKIVSLILCFSLVAVVVPLGITSFAASEPTVQIQWTEKWKSYYYGGANRGNLYDTGCGVFSFCNSVYYLTGNNPSITEVAQWAADKGYLNGAYGGTDHRFHENMSAQYASRFGFSVVSGSGTWAGWSSTSLKNHLKSGGVAIGNVPNHYIAIVGYNATTNKYHIYDSAPRADCGTTGGNVWLSESELAGYPKMKLNWYCLLNRTGAAPSWYGGSTSYNPQGSIDSVVAGTKSVSFGGWAFDKDNSSQSLEIRVYIGGDVGVGEAHSFMANTERADVNSAYGITGNHGFANTVTTNKVGEQTVYIYAVNIGGGSNKLLGTRTVTIMGNSFNPQGSVDIIRADDQAVSVGGWAFDKDNSSQSLEIRVYIGGDVGVGEAHTITANTERADVNSAYGITGNHGFASTISTNKLGEQTVYVYAVNIGGGEDKLLGSSTVTILSSNSAKPQGLVDFVRTGEQTVSFGGWAFDEDNFSQSVEIYAYIGGDIGIGEEHYFVANTQRDDVNSTYGITGNHGFASTVSTNLYGEQPVYIYAVNIGGGANALLGTQTVTIARDYGLSLGTPVNMGDSFYARIYNAEYNKYVSVNSNGELFAEAKQLIQSQVWKFERNGDDASYKIVSALYSKNIDLVDSNPTPGTDIIVWDETGTDAQRWYLVSKDGGYVLQCKAAKSNALDIDDGGQTGIACWEAHGRANQIFQIETVSDPYELSAGVPANIGDSFFTKIYNAEYDRSIGLNGEYPVATANTEDASQIWKFERQTDDASYKITNVKTGKTLDLSNSDDSHGADIITYQDNGGNNQRWYLVAVNGGYILQSKCAKNNALDIDIGGVTRIASCEEYGGTNQIFQISKLAVYTVNHYTQNLSGKASLKDTTNYSLAISKILNLSLGSSVTAVFEKFSNHVTPAKITVTPAADGSTVVNYFYPLRYGDVNEDETVNASDLTILKQRLIAKQLGSEISNVLSDINGDGKIDLKDMLRLKKYLADSNTKVGS